MSEESGTSSSSCHFNRTHPKQSTQEVWQWKWRLPGPDLGLENGDSRPVVLGILDHKVYSVRCMACPWREDQQIGKARTTSPGGHSPRELFKGTSGAASSARSERLHLAWLTLRNTKPPHRSPEVAIEFRGERRRQGRRHRRLFLQKHVLQRGGLFEERNESLRESASVCFFRAAGHNVGYFDFKFGGQKETPGFAE